jgi:Ca-activated chloride channel family protein
VKGLAASTILALIAVLPASAQPLPEPVAQLPVFRSGASLVALHVTVTGPDKRFVTGLDAGDFAVYEDGVEQNVQFFESNAVPIDLIVLIDTSSSMRHRMDMVHQAALGFIGTLRSGDRAAVVSFSDTVTIVQGLTGDRAVLETAIRSTKAQGGTALHNALYVALKQFGRGARDNNQVRRQALAVLSDGEDTASLIGFDDVLEVAHKSGVTIYPIALASGLESRSPSGSRYFSQSQYAMRRLAQETGAQAFFPARIHELAGIYAAIAEELSYQYSIAYASTNARLDGRFRRVSVRVTTRPELRPRSRTGYIAAVKSVPPDHGGEIR